MAEAFTKILRAVRTGDATRITHFRAYLLTATRNAAFDRRRGREDAVDGFSPVFSEQPSTSLSPGDVIIDGGNTHYAETERRTKYVESKGLLYIGAGVSGGEEGARRGPSIMPGGSRAAWEHVKPIFQAIAAKVAGGIGGAVISVPLYYWCVRGGGQITEY